MNTNSSRFLEVSFQQAIEWYYSNNFTLQELALKLFSKEELDITLTNIHNHPKVKFTRLPVTEKSTDKLSVLADLIAIADILNKDWEKTANNEGYYFTSVPSKDTNQNRIIIKNSIEKCPYTVYFKSVNLAEIAKKILHNRLKYLFN